MEALLVLGDDPSLREGVKDLIRIGKFEKSKFYSVNVFSKFTSRDSKILKISIFYKIHREIHFQVRSLVFSLLKVIPPTIKKLTAICPQLCLQSSF